jgi:hypothetical protein
VSVQNDFGAKPFRHKARNDKVSSCREKKLSEHLRPQPARADRKTFAVIGNSRRKEPGNGRVERSAGLVSRRPIPGVTGRYSGFRLLETLERFGGFQPSATPSHLCDTHQTVAICGGRCRLQRRVRGRLSRPSRLGPIGPPVTRHILWEFDVLSISIRKKTLSNVKRMKIFHGLHGFKEISRIFPDPICEIRF